MCQFVQHPLWKVNAEWMDCAPPPTHSYNPVLSLQNVILLQCKEINWFFSVFSFFKLRHFYAQLIFVFDSFLEQRLLALEARYGRELQGLQSEKQQLQELLESQSQLVTQLQGELGSSTLNSTLLQRQQATLTDTVQQLLAMVNNCNGKGLTVCGWATCASNISYFKQEIQMYITREKTYSHYEIEHEFTSTVFSIRYTV